MKKVQALFMTNAEISILYEDATALLKQLISVASFSKEEEKTADAIEAFLNSKKIIRNRFLNNVWAVNKYYDVSKPTLLLNSHHDTVKPNKGYTIDPFTAAEKEGKLYGLGSNDAGGCLVSLIATFVHFYNKENLPFNFLLAATAEEEISGKNGIEALLVEEKFKQYNITCALVGEPTLLNMAVAEKGLLVLDCTAYGKAGHAAREEGDNAIYKAIKDIEWFNTYRFDKVSPLLGPMKMSVTIINAGSQHNVVPHECSFTVDVRVNELYTFEEVLSIIKQHTTCHVEPRSIRLRSTAISLDHSLVKGGLSLGKNYYGSPTTSDKALMPFPALKIGPGDSARSHTADEFIYLDEIEQGIQLYITLLHTIISSGNKI